MGKLETAFSNMPIICVLRGIQPKEVLDIAAVLLSHGFNIMEVPLNSPKPFESIGLLVKEFGSDAVIGAGTVLDTVSVDRLADVGGEIMVSPNTDDCVIKRSIDREIIPIPGFATATEAFKAINAGASYLKLFPANVYGCEHLLSLKAILPSQVKLVATGGLSKVNILEWFEVGVDGVGLGSNLYSTGDRPEDVSKKAKMITDTIKNRLH
ncbi:2-dehydro-3-deoxy-6-phosphogalactonate aldolase [SAR92 clade bacterium H921]|nr:2-dehydro-3-deoxy-6-phosphogalactonate aldolase [SAR92 clade bacterium H921]